MKKLLFFALFISVGMNAFAQADLLPYLLKLQGDWVGLTGREEDIARDEPRAPKKDVGTNANGNVPYTSKKSRSSSSNTSKPSRPSDQNRGPRR